MVQLVSDSSSTQTQIFGTARLEKTIYLLMSLFVAAAGLVLLAQEYFLHPDEWHEARTFSLLATAAFLLVAILIGRVPFRSIKLTVSSVGIKYNDAGSTTSGTWSEVEQVGTLHIGAREFEGLFLQEPSFITRKWWVFGGWFVRKFYGQDYTRFINLTVFDRKWQTGEIGRAIKQYAPHLIDEVPASSDTRAAEHRLGGWLALVGLWLVLVSVSAVVVIVSSSELLMTGTNAFMGSKIETASITDLQLSALFLGIVFSLVTLIFAVPVLTHFFARTSFFRRIMRAFIVTRMILVILGFVAAQTIRYFEGLEVAPAGQTAAFNVNLLVHGALLFYLNAADRVKKTFIM